MKTAIALVALTAALTLLVAAPSAFAVADFRTPDRAAYCGSDQYTGHHLICWTPNDGFTVRMTQNGRPSKRYLAANRDYYDLVGRTLRFGQTWRSGNFKCVSTRNGLTCTNRRGHGWWLGRFVGYRLF
jgi:hypothetical protein